MADRVNYNFGPISDTSRLLMDEAAGTGEFIKRFGDVAPLSPSDSYLQDLQRSRVFEGKVKGASTGLESGLQYGQYAASGDPWETGLGIGAGAVSGAAAGAAGGLPGMLIGGGVGAVTSALSSYMSYKKAKKQERAMRRLQKKAEAAEEKRVAKMEAAERLSKLEALSNLKYDRAQAKVADEWNKWMQMSQWVANQQAQSANTKSTFIQQGWV